MCQPPPFLFEEEQMKRAALLFELADKLEEIQELLNAVGLELRDGERS